MRGPTSGAAAARREGAGVSEGPGHVGGSQGACLERGARVWRLKRGVHGWGAAAAWADEGVAWTRHRGATRPDVDG